MIKCRPYKAEFKTGATCIRNQQKIKELKDSGRDSFQRKNTSEEILSAMPAEYFRIKECDGCKVGIALYKKAAKEGRVPREFKINYSRISNKKRLSMIACEAYHRQNAHLGW
jgi:hypothetical protein